MMVAGFLSTCQLRRWAQAFEQFFATPQTVQLDTLCQAYGIAHQRVQDWDSLVAAISVLPYQWRACARGADGS